MKKVLFIGALLLSFAAQAAPTTHREFVEALDNVGTLASGDETYVRDVSAAGSLQSKSMTIANIGTFVIASDAEIAALAGLTSAADRLAYFTGSGTASLATFTAAGRNLVDDADTSAQRTTLGLAIGTDVQAYDADLGALAGNSTNGIWARTGAGTGSARTLTGTSNRVTITNGDGVSGNPTFDVGSNVYTVSGTDVALADGGTGASLTDPNADRIMFWDDSAGATTWLAPEGVLSISGTSLRATIPLLQVAISDETTAMTTGQKIAVRMPCAATLTNIRGSVTTVSSSGTPTWDIKESGTTIFSTKLTIDASEKTSTTAAVAAVISDSAIADDAEITVHVDTAGTGTAGGKVTIYGYCN